MAQKTLISLNMESIQEVFKKIKIEPKVMGIETMFNNQRRLDKTISHLIKETMYGIMKKLLTSLKA